MEIDNNFEMLDDNWQDPKPTFLGIRGRYKGSYVSTHGVKVNYIIEETSNQSTNDLGEVDAIKCMICYDGGQTDFIWFDVLEDRIQCQLGRNIVGYYKDRYI